MKTIYNQLSLYNKLYGIITIYKWNITSYKMPKLYEQNVIFL